ncbi:MAG: hypothetical protein AB3N21_09675 [Ruegeria sp.]|uniref:hypothetical protein n=1 Tax=Ruegeria sp. TaxID=1879320 RepID=UPI00349E7C0D
MRTEFGILEDVKTLAIEYYNVTEKPLGVTGEIAEFEAACLLDLHLTEARSAGYDAVRVTDGKRQTIQIKGRRKGKRRTWGMVPSINTDKAFDTVVLVLLTEGFDVHEIWEHRDGRLSTRLTSRDRRPATNAARWRCRISNPSAIGSGRSPAIVSSI